MMLLVDAGNTRIKWALLQDTTWIAEGLLEHNETGRLSELASVATKPERAICVNVAGESAGERITRALGAFGIVPEWFRSSSACCGVTNSYDKPSQLGADRWAAMIGARALHGEACVVVCAGTATTIDVLDADGLFQGGLILPGEHLMRLALADNTAQLGFADGQFQSLPRNTPDAIISGCRQAQAGAIERMFHQVKQHTQAMCLLTGGGSAKLTPLLSIPLRRVDNLVLHGLAVYAATKNKCQF